MSLFSHPWPACQSMPLPIPERTGHTYTHTETTYPIRYYFLCVQSQPVLWLPVWSTVFNNNNNTPWNSPARIPPSFLLGCVQCWFRSPARCRRVSCRQSAHALSAQGLQDSFWKRPEPVRGKDPMLTQVMCFRAVENCCLFPTSFAFLQASCNNFFFCKIFCKQQQNTRFSNRGKERWCHGQEPAASPSAPCHHLATCCWHEWSRCKQPFCTEIYFLWRICKIIKYAVIFWLM